ncbi:MAG: FAD-binding oxidoreductase [Propionibacteriaceae bacterium]|jgi:D-lactate dehydrogenase|nr:FAD-binding oxidoreductase [Propionibacteriaceae bacterium]
MREEELVPLLASCLSDPDRVRTSAIERRAKAHDASHFLLLPQAVVVAHDTAEVAQLLRQSRQSGFGLTFRSGGTSLSGQAGGDQVMIDTRRHFHGIEVLDSGRRVRVEPGLTVARVNAQLAPYGYKLGPDPASETACTIGGVVADNSSGMACGTVENSYRTIESMVVALSSGTVLDTASPDADARLRELEPELHAGLLELRRRVLDHPAWVDKIAQQYSMKNTMGYGLNSLVDFERPVDILTHLMVGSEGTLGFVAQVTFRTVPIRPQASSALLVFKDLHDANRALPALVEAGAATLELMDTTSLRVGQSFADCPEAIRRIEIAAQAALLLEFQSVEAAALAELTERAAPVLAQLPLTDPVELTSDPAIRGRLWSFRKGLYTSVASARPPGTTALLEDTAVPVAALADTCVELAQLFERYGYQDAVIFGHAKDGNIHFMLTDRYESDQAMRRYAAFTEDMVDLILGQSGSLKAEHGTGRVMAPYVKRQFGDDLYQVMVDLKRLFDPAGLMNPGVLINPDPEAHLSHFKIASQVDADIDRCVECGYCEPICPSRDLTLTPRQRIAVYREMNDARRRGDLTTAEDLQQAYVYDGIQTCAVDGLCGTACPVKINTGLLVKKFRRRTVPGYAGLLWSTAAKHWRATTGLASGVLGLTSHLPGPLASGLIGLDQAARSVLGNDVVPLWSRELPAGGQRRARPQTDSEPVAVYLPACVNTMFGPASGPGVQASFERLCALAGLSLAVPEGVDGLCCGTPWTSKGIAKGHQAMSQRVLKALARASSDWALPIVCDASSCTEGLIRMIREEAGQKAEIVDAVQFVADRVLPALGPIDRLDSITLHQTCSSTEIGLNPALRQVAQAVAHQVNVPLDTGCCAFAGDRGLLHPELTASATRAEAAEVQALGAEAHASCNRTCELGLTRATGQTYRHILEILAEQVAAPTS